MIRTFAQAAPNNGASTSSDFQPTTRNPQTAPSSIQQQSGLQGVTNPQEFLNDNKQTQLSVAAEPAAAQPQAAPKDVTMLVIISSVAIVVGILLFKISKKLPSKKPIKAAYEPASADPVEPVVAKEVKKPVAKRKSSKKTKRRNR